MHESDKKDLKCQTATVAMLTGGLLTSTYGAIELNGRDNTSAESNHFVTLELPSKDTTVSVEQAGLLALTGIGIAASFIGARRILETWH